MQSSKPLITINVRPQKTSDFGTEISFRIRHFKQCDQNWRTYSNRAVKRRATKVQSLSGLWQNLSQGISAAHCLGKRITCTHLNSCAFVIQWPTLRRTVMEPVQMWGLITVTLTHQMVLWGHVKFRRGTPPSPSQKLAMQKERSPNDKLDYYCCLQQQLQQISCTHRCNPVLSAFLEWVLACLPGAKESGTTQAQDSQPLPSGLLPS